MFRYVKCLLIAGSVLAAGAGCGIGTPSPEEIEAQIKAAHQADIERLAGLEATEKKPPLMNPSTVVVNCGPVGSQRDVVTRGFELAFEGGVPVRATALQPFRYEGVYCGRSETVSLNPSESRELASILDFYAAKQYTPMTFGSCFGPISNFKIDWYDADGDLYVSSSVPRSLVGNSRRTALWEWADSLGIRCIPVPMLLESLEDDDPCMRHFALRHIEARVRLDQGYLVPYDRAVSALSGGLDDPEARLRVLAAACLFTMFDVNNAYCEQATEVLIQIAKTGERWARCDAIRELANPSAARTDAVVDVLLGALRDKDQDIRCAAAGAFRYYKEVPWRMDDIFAGLTAALDDEKAHVRTLAAGSIESLRQYYPDKSKLGEE